MTYSRFNLDPHRAIEKKNLLERLLEISNTQFVFFCVLMIVLIFLGLALLCFYFCWLIAIPALAKWGFDTFNSSTFWWGSWSIVKGILAVLGIIVAAVIPIMPFTFVDQPIRKILDRFDLDQRRRSESLMDRARRKQQEYEDILKKEEATGLIPLVNFSKYELEQYYQIGLDQGRKSYKTSLLAMWIGFAILLFAIILFIMPFPDTFLPKNGSKKEVQVLMLASGIISELVAGLFLWIYKSSKNQLTYFYNRQVFIHNSLLAYKIATTMDKVEKKDAAKQVIIQEILAFGTVSSKMAFENETKNGQISKRPTKGSKLPALIPDKTA